MRYIQQGSKKGFVLAIVLWIVAAILLGITTIAIFSKDTVSLSQSLQDKLVTRMESQDVLEGLKFYIITANFDNISFINSNLKDFTYNFPDRLISDGRWYNLNDTVKIKLLDTSSLLNIVTADPNLIAAIAAKNLQNQLKYSIADSIKDWRDKDNFMHLNGAENSTYELKKKVAYKIRNNRGIQDVEEMRLINGIDSLTIPQWNAFKGKLYYGFSAGITNLDLIDVKYLAYILNFSEADAQILVDIRSKDLQKFMNIVYALPQYNDQYMGFYLTRQIKIEIQVTKNKAKSILKTMIYFKPTKDRQYTTVTYAIY